MMQACEIYIYIYVYNSTLVYILGTVFLIFNTAENVRRKARLLHKTLDSVNH